MCRQHIDQVVHISVLRVAYEGARIVQVHDADPEILNGLSSLVSGAAELDMQPSTPPTRPPPRT